MAKYAILETCALTWQSLSGRQEKFHMPPWPTPDTLPPCVPDEPAKTEVFGCSKCKMLKSGCLACNPAKTVKHLVKTQPELFQSED